LPLKGRRSPRYKSGSRWRACKCGGEGRPCRASRRGFRATTIHARVLPSGLPTAHADRQSTGPHHCLRASSPALSSKIVRTRTDLGSLVIGIQERAGVNREAAATDAGREPIADCLECCDALVYVFPPPAGQTLPVAAAWSPVRGKRRKGCADPVEGNSRRTTGLDQRDPPKDCPLVSPLVSRCSARGDQAFLLVEAEC
jgi:hypothetical protein